MATRSGTSALTMFRRGALPDGRRQRAEANQAPLDPQTHFARQPRVELVVEAERRRCPIEVVGPGEDLLSVLALRSCS
jgi:hypothetical protein